MSLEGSLETVALPEVLQLLCDTSKTGELLVRGDRGEGKLWFAQGRLTGFAVGRADQPADALFDLLRTGEGRFSFDADASRPDDSHQVGDDAGEEVRPVLEVAQARLAEWTEIVSVVPSLDHVVRLAESEPADGVILEAGQWGLVVAIGEGRSVQDVLDRASLPEFDGCRSLKGLVEAGLATVSQPARKPRSRKTSSAAQKEAVAEVVEEPVAAEEEVEVEETQAEDLVFEAHDDRADLAVSDEVAPVEETPGDEHVAEAPLDPGEFVFSISTGDDVPDVDVPGVDVSRGEPVEAPAEELAPWSVQLVESGGAQDYEEEFVPRHVPLPEPHDDHFADDNGSLDHRAALAALIAEIPADDDHEGPHEEAPDGLADRGPWTSRELDEMTGWGQEDSHHEEAASGSLYDVEAEQPVSAAPTRFHAYRDLAAPTEEAVDYSAHDAEPEDDSVDEEDETEIKPEPVNRGLLLKFLSSVRS